MNKNTIATAALAATLTASGFAAENKEEKQAMASVPIENIVIADEKSNSGDFMSNISGSLTATYNTKALAPLGFTPSEDPNFEYTLFAKHDSGIYGLVKNRHHMDGAERFWSLGAVGKSWEANGLKGFVELDYFDIPEFDSWFEIYTGVNKTFETDLGNIRVGVEASHAFRDQDGLYTALSIHWDKALTDKLTASIDNKTGYTFGNYFGIEGEMANSTAIQLTYKLNDDVSVFGKFMHNESLTEKLESNSGVTIGATYKF